jgi:hypothetical protein
MGLPGEAPRSIERDNELMCVAIQRDDKSKHGLDTTRPDSGRFALALASWSSNRTFALKSPRAQPFHW